MADDFDDLHIGMRNLFGEYPFQSFEEIGKDYANPIQELEIGYEGPIGKEVTRLRWHFSSVLYRNGYALNWSNVIVRGENGMFDNSLYKVRNNKFKGRDKPKQHGAEAAVPFVGLGRKPVLEDPEEEWCACKIVSLYYYRQQNPGFANSVEDIDRIIRKEGNLLTHLRHKNIVLAHAFIELQDRVSPFPNPYMAIIMELMEGVFRQLLPVDGPDAGRMSENEMRFCVKDILSGLRYLHWGPHRDPVDNHPLHISHNAVFHRNILYKKIGNRTIFKLSDFEMAQIIRDDQRHLTPEVFWGRDCRHLARILYIHRPLNYPVPMRRMYTELNGGEYPNRYPYLLPNGTVDYPRVDILLNNPWLADIQ